MSTIISLELDSLFAYNIEAFYGKICERVKVDLSGDVIIESYSEEFSLKKHDCFKISNENLIKLFTFFKDFNHKGSAISSDDKGMWVLSLYYSDGTIITFSDSFNLSKDTLVASDALRVLLNRPTLVALDSCPKKERISSFTITLKKSNELLEKIIFNEGEKTLKLYKNDGFKEKYIEIKLQVFQLENIEKAFPFEFFLESQIKLYRAEYDFSFTASTLYHGKYCFDSPFYYKSINLPIEGLLSTIKEITKETNSFILFNDIARKRKKNEYIFAKASFEGYEKGYSFMTLNPYIRKEAKAIVETNNSLKAVEIKELTTDSAKSSPFPFSKTKAIYSLLDVDNPIIKPLSEEKAVEHFFKTISNSNHAKDASFLPILINSISVLLSSNLSVYIPAIPNSELNEKAQYYIIHNDELSLFPCFLNEADFESEKSAVLHVVSITEYVRIFNDIPNVKEAIIIRGHEHAIISRRYINIALVHPIKSTVLEIAVKQEDIKADIMIIYKESALYLEYRESGLLKGKKTFFPDEGIYLLKNDHYYSPIELYDIFDKLSNSGYTSISISKSIDSDIYNIARSYQLLHSDKLLDIYICL